MSTDIDFNNSFIENSLKYKFISLIWNSICKFLNEKPPRQKIIYEQNEFFVE